jgi:hypothetical protein
MIGAKEQTVPGAVGIGEASHAGMTAEQIVESRATYKFFIDAEINRGIEFIAEHIEAGYFRDVPSGILFSRLIKKKLVEIWQLLVYQLTEYRWQMVLLVEVVRCIRFSIKMDGYGGDSQQGAAEIYQKNTECTITHCTANPAGQGEIAVKPWVEQAAPIYLDTKLMI